MRLRHLAASFALLTLLSTPAFAQETDAQKQAGSHFQRAVGLYSEADYRAALVEFKRAYELAPHVTVLYNIGQTYYQLQNYALALTTFERFLAEGGTAHRSEVEQAVSILKSRVGKVEISSPTPGWDITIDDEPSGKTPLTAAVSIGRRKIVASKAGESPQTQFAEIAAGETAKVTLSAGVGSAGGKTETISPPSEPKKSSPLLTVGWIGTGALVAGAVVTGILASGAASDLDAARDKFPADKKDIDDKASTTTTLAITTDVLAGAAIVLGAVCIYFTVTGSSSSSKNASWATGRFTF